METSHLVLFLLLATGAYALSIPPYLDFQAMVRNTTSNTSITGPCSTTLSFLTSAGGSTTYTETTTQTVNPYGVLNYYVGSTSPLTTSAILASGYATWEACGQAGGATIASVPFAFVADTALHVIDSVWENATNRTRINSAYPQRVELNGTLVLPGGFKIMGQAGGGVRLEFG